MHTATVATTWRRALLRCAWAAVLLLVTLVGARAADAYDQGLLWRVEKAGAAPSHVFGTIHVDDPRVIRLAPPVARRFDAAASFTLEVDLAPEALAQIAGRMVYTDGRSLEQVAGPALYGKVVAASGHLGLPVEALMMFKPWAVAVLLTVPQQHGDALDVALLKRARQQGKRVFELETLEEQLSLFDALPETEQLMMLRDTVDNRDGVQRDTREMVDAWVARDLGTLARISDRSGSNDPEIAAFNARFKTRVLDARNTRMVDRMQPQLAAGGAFVAVGALHLHGDRGVLALLAQRGYAVIREW